MKAQDVMSAPVVTVAPEAPVPEIAALLIERQISAVPVVDGGAVVGIVSEGDLLRRGETRTERRRPGWLEMLLNRDIQAAGFVKEHGTCARDVMTADVIAVAPDTDLAEIARILERRRVKRVPVIDKGRLVGIVSRANLLRGLVAYRHSPAGLDAKSDPDLARAVEERLSREAWIDLRRMNIVVTDGVVHLWGAIDSAERRRALALAAAEIPRGQARRGSPHARLVRERRRLSFRWRGAIGLCQPSAAVESA
jgi:CBS-domain-containing membrane protein